MFLQHLRVHSDFPCEGIESIENLSNPTLSWLLAFKKIVTGSLLNVIASMSDTFGIVFCVGDIDIDTCATLLFPL